MHLDFARHLNGFAFTGGHSLRKFVCKGPATEDLVGVSTPKIQERGAGGRRSLAVHLALEAQN